MASFLPSTFAFSPNPSNIRSKPLRFFSPRRFQSVNPIHASSTEGEPEEEDPPGARDPHKLAFAKAETYKKAKRSAPTQDQNPAPDSRNGADGGGEPAPEISASVKLAMERAKEYKKNKGAVGGGEQVSVVSPTSSGKGNITTSADDILDSKISKKEASRISSIDFLGLEFSEKKSYRGAPPGLVPVVESFLDGDVPEVELIVGDSSKFDDSTASTKMKSEKDDNAVLYKPKVSTWGVFPRPNNISRTYGGGRNIQPGEVLETAEDKAEKEKRSKELVAAYKSKMGLTIDAKVKAECEKALKEGDNLMERGKLREALPYYEKVMNDVIFQSELHGRAALQWSICQDSLSRPNEAKLMYEKLQSHSNVQVRKKARQFMYSFQAMAMMKVTSSSRSKTTGYETYFDAFVDNKNNYTAKEEEQNEDGIEQVIPYIMFLISPIFFLLLIAVRKSFPL
ncbi:uncharacterized protein [Typha latifolia]|uniref:uncharacterized protein n=1 Tax=Typha latifolia TaxID=4733 RepID=UPI003C2FF2CE